MQHLRVGGLQSQNVDHNVGIMCLIVSSVCSCGADAKSCVQKEKKKQEKEEIN